MKKGALLLLFFAVSIFSYAQDIIVMQDGSEVKSKIIEISETDIKYKKYDYQAGPTYVLSLSKIFMITYENGEKELFGKNKESNSAGRISESQSIPVPEKNLVEKVTNTHQETAVLPNRTPKEPEIQKPAKKFYGYLKAGIGFNKLSNTRTAESLYEESFKEKYPYGEYAATPKRKIGYNFQTGFNHYSGKSFYWGAELGIDNFGYRMKFTSVYDEQIYVIDEAFFIKTTNLSLTPKVGFKIDLGNKLNLDLEIGPYGTYILGGKYGIKEKEANINIEYDIFSLNTDTDLPFDLQDTENRLDYGFHGSATLWIDFIGINIQYKHTLSDFYYSGSKADGINLSLAFRF